MLENGEIDPGSGSGLVPNLNRFVPSLKVYIIPQNLVQVRPYQLQLGITNLHQLFYAYKVLPSARAGFDQYSVLLTLSFTSTGL